MRKPLLALSAALVLACVTWAFWSARPIDAPGEALRTDRPAPVALPSAFEPVAARQEPIPGLVEKLTDSPVGLPGIERPKEVPLARTRPEALPLPPEPEVAKAAPKEAFVRLAVGQKRPVDFQMDESTRRRLTEREQKDQLRDWLLYTVVGESGLSPDAISRALFDVPAVRHGYLRPIANFEYGDTRSCFIGEERVVALIPQCGDKERADHLAHVADEYRKTLGVIPATVLVFEYELDVARLLGSVTRRPDLLGNDLFTAAYGYHEKSVKDLAGFQEFLGKVQDITYARAEGGDAPLGRGDFGRRRARVGGSVTLGGRKPLARDYGGKRGFGAAQVATVWQAQEKIRREKERFDADYKAARDKLKAAWQVKLDGLNSRYKLDLITEEAYKRGAADVQRGFSVEEEALAKEWGGKYREGRLMVDGTGFSLDPTYDYEGLAKWYNKEAAPHLKRIAGKAGAPIKEADVEAAGASLTKAGEHREVPLLTLLDKLKKSEDIGASLWGQLLDGSMKGYQFQAARYDGDLQGTEVGMTLYYTDLLAKLWASVGYDSPKKQIPDFPTGPDGGAAPFYRKETEERPNTRLWFGPEERGFHLVDARQGMHFARRATRIFAASSNPLRPGIEEPAGQRAERTLGWWNDHYEEVASHEPEYERLNEYMKWSLIVSWLFADGKQDRLAFLADVEVDRTAWFGDWVKKNRDLRFRFTDHKSVVFHERGYKGTKTEAIPILESKRFENFGEVAPRWTISGGVSGGRPQTLRERPVLPDLVGRTQLSLRGVKVESFGRGGRDLTTIAGNKHSFTEPAPGRAAMHVDPKPEQPLRAPDAQLAHARIERTVSRTERGLVVETGCGEARLGSLSVEPRGDGFAVGFRSREIDLAHGLAHDLSKSGKSPAEFLAGDARVETLVRKDGEAFVKLQGADKWVKVTPEAGESATVAAGFDSRVAATDTAGAKTYNLAWVDSASVKRVLEAGEYLRFEPRSSVDRRSAIVVLARGPPLDKARAVKVGAAEGAFDAHIDAKAEVLLVPVRGLPPERLADPQRLSRLLEAIDRPAVLKELSNAKATPRIGGGPPPSGREALIGHLEHGRKPEAARLFAENPEGARELLRRDLDRRSKDLVGLLEQNRPAEALTQAELALRIHPANPRLLLLRGLGKVGVGRHLDAGLAELAGRQADRPGAMLNTIQALLKGRKLSPQQRQAALVLRRDAATRGLRVEKKTAATAKITTTADGAVLEAQLPAAIRREPAKPADLTRDALLYLDDSPALSNRDWSPAGREKTVRQAVESGEAEFYKIPEPDAAFQARPDWVQVPEAGGATAGAPRRLTRAVPQAASGSPQDDDEDEEEVELTADPTKPGQVVAKVKKARPVYLLRYKGKR